MELITSHISWLALDNLPACVLQVKQKQLFNSTTHPYPRTLCNLLNVPPTGLVRMLYSLLEPGPTKQAHPCPTETLCFTSSWGDELNDLWVLGKPAVPLQHMQETSARPKSVSD